MSQDAIDRITAEMEENGLILYQGQIRMKSDVAALQAAAEATGSASYAGGPSMASSAVASEVGTALRIGSGVTPPSSSHTQDGSSSFAPTPARHYSSATGGLYGDAAPPSSFPVMTKLAGPSATQFMDWKNKAETYFQSNGLTEIVTMDPARSLQMALDIDANTRSPHAVRAIWVRMHSRAFGTLRQAVEAVVGTHFFDEIKREHNLNALKAEYSNAPIHSTDWIPYLKFGNASYLWSLLQKKYQQFDAFELARLAGDYLSLSYSMGQNPVDFRRKFDDSVREMELAGLPISDKLHVAIWYRALPKELTALKQTFNGNPNLTHENIYNALLSYHQANKSQGEKKEAPRSGDEKALKFGDNPINQSNPDKQGNGKRTHGRPRHIPKNMQQDRSQAFCSFCDRKGHEQRECYSYAREQTRIAGLMRGGSSSQQGNGGGNHEFSCPFFETGMLPALDAANPPTQEEVLLAADGTHCSVPPAIFIFDSGSTTHVTGHRSLLSNIKQVPEVEMTTAVRGQRSIVRERGSVRLSQKWTLHDVAYVPHASANLLSEGRLCDAGFTISKTKDVIRVFTPDGKLAMRGIRVNRLWVLTTEDAAPIAQRPINTLRATRNEKEKEKSSRPSNLPPAATGNGGVSRATRATVATAATAPKASGRGASQL
jgi:Pol polyprotein, beta-barrel domain